MIGTTSKLSAKGNSKMGINENINLGLTNIWEVVCLDSDGNEKWREEKKNLIVTEGLNHILNTQFNAGTQVTTWYIGIKGAGTVAAADTLASHAGWSEVSSYSGTRKEWTEGAASAGSMTNATSVDFSITGTATCAGAFLCSVTSGTAGTLYGAVDFGTSRSVISGDTLQVTVTVTAASA